MIPGQILIQTANAIFRRWNVESTNSPDLRFVGTTSEFIPMALWVLDSHVTKHGFSSHTERRPITGRRFLVFDRAPRSRPYARH